MNFPLEKGAFLLSIDTELAWGSVHNGSFQSRSGHYARTREAINRLLELQERYEIRATWAMVGHLFLDSCRRENGIKHPEITRPTYDWFEGDWFDVDPCSDAGADPFWYGPDIVKQVQACPVPQEIGCHGFSHMIVGDTGCSRECFNSELRACVEQAEKWGVTLKSFIFPRNSVGHLDVLAENGFSTYRGWTPAWFTRFPGRFRQLARLVDSVVPVAPPAVSPQRSGLMWDLPASYFYPHRDGWAKYIPVGIAVRKSKLGLERAARQRSMFHLWFHPFNLASDPDGLLKGLEEIFIHVNRLREAGKMTNPTMGDLSEMLQEAAPQEVTG
jgi:peptidoglycan/xylan/chitin deacetylase (PgdA/CDA1 family)